MKDREHTAIPAGWVIRRAVELYLAEAYGRTCPAAIRSRLEQWPVGPAELLMSDEVERSPANAELAQVRVFAIRLGNSLYPHMKLRLSRPPNASLYVFSVDCHDAFLAAPPGSADAAELGDLKRHNAELACAIRRVWEQAGLPTDTSFLRDKIDQAKRSRPGGAT